MSSSSPLKEAISFYATLSHGTQVLYRWAEWQSQQPVPANRLMIFRKDDLRLLVHQHGPLCSLLKMADVGPKIRGFREWRQPLATVSAELIRRGWKVVQDSEVTHGH